MCIVKTNEESECYTKIELEDLSDGKSLHAHTPTEVHVPYGGKTTLVPSSHLLITQNVHKWNLSFIVLSSLYASTVGLIIVNKSMTTAMKIFQLQMKASFFFNAK